MSRLARFRRCAIVRVASLALLPAGFAAHAGELTIPHSFSAGTPAQAAQVNANFAATRTAVNDNDARIAALETHLAALQSQVAALQSQVAAIEVSAVMALEPYLSLANVPDPNDAGVSYATIRLTGVNLQIRNGTNPYATTPNGLGNLIIGHNTLHTGTADSLYRCSDGEYDDGPNCVFNGGTWAVNHRSGSHNLIVGNRHRYSAFYGVAFGETNSVTGNYATVTGGFGHIARGRHAVVSGGYMNEASGQYSSVSGGQANTASGDKSSVSGGNLRSATGQFNWRAGTLSESN